jgi:hypothetical protein
MEEYIFLSCKGLGEMHEKALFFQHNRDYEEVSTFSPKNSFHESKSHT